MLPSGFPKILPKMFPTCSAADVRLLAAHVGLEAGRAASGQRGGDPQFFVVFLWLPQRLDGEKI